MTSQARTRARSRLEANEWFATPNGTTYHRDQHCTAARGQLWRVYVQLPEGHPQRCATCGTSPGEDAPQ